VTWPLTVGCSRAVTTRPTEIGHIKGRATRDANAHLFFTNLFAEATAERAALASHCLRVRRGPKPGTAAYVSPTSSSETTKPNLGSWAKSLILMVAWGGIERCEKPFQIKDLAFTLPQLLHFLLQSRLGAWASPHHRPKCQSKLKSKTDRREQQLFRLLTRSGLIAYRRAELLGRRAAACAASAFPIIC